MIHRFRWFKFNCSYIIDIHWYSCVYSIHIYSIYRLSIEVLLCRFFLSYSVRGRGEVLACSSVFFLVWEPHDIETCAVSPEIWRALILAICEVPRYEMIAKLASNRQSRSLADACRCQWCPMFLQRDAESLLVMEGGCKMLSRCVQSGHIYLHLKMYWASFLSE